ncbi:hypothetical protein C8R44DRAFT_631106 [Mycena epipterygia]|nr:hypothetical protein C8R44DRAFT_631106 [Mycena epipterygia]
MTVNGVDQRVSSAVGAPGQPSFEFMFAPLLIGVLLNALLFGVFIVQAHSYFRLYKTCVLPRIFSSALTASSDFGWIRYFVYYLILMETINTVCDVGLIYEPLIMLHGACESPLASHSSLCPNSFSPTLISTPTQLFMAWRIRRVTRSNYLSGVVALLAPFSTVGGIAATIGVAQQREFAKFPLIAGSLTLWLTSTAFADMFITAFLVDFLWKNKTGFRTQTDSVTDRIIFFTVQTGMLTSVAAIVDASLFFIFPVRWSSVFVFSTSLPHLRLFSNFLT